MIVSAIVGATILTMIAVLSVDYSIKEMLMAPLNILSFLKNFALKPIDICINKFISIQEKTIKRED